MSLIYHPNSADTARANGLQVGTTLVGELAGFGETRIEITAIGEENILARIVSDYRPGWPTGETGWELNPNRDWWVLA